MLSRKTPLRRSKISRSAEFLTSSGVRVVAIGREFQDPTMKRPVWKVACLRLSSSAWHGNLRVSKLTPCNDVARRLRARCR